MILQSTNNQMITFGGKNKNDKTYNILKINMLWFIS